jgi:hypothetical protein
LFIIAISHLSLYAVFPEVNLASPPQPVIMGLKSYFKPHKAIATPEAVTPGNASTAPASSGVSAVDGFVSHKTSLYSEETQRDIILSYLFQKQCLSMWIQDTAGATEGVILKQSRDTFLTMPVSLQGSLLHRAIIALNAKVRTKLWQGIALEAADLNVRPP